MAHPNQTTSQNTHSLSLSLSLVHLSLHSLTFKQSKEEEGEGKEGRLEVVAVEDVHGEDLGAEHHKR
jgi:hypothetical protein